MEINKNIKDKNTFGIDISTAKYVEFRTIEELKNIFKDVGSDKWYVLGGGSNTLFTSDFKGTIIHPISDKIEIIGDSNIKVDAGVDWDYFVAYSIDNKLYGAENLSYIPGDVGASPVQNIGAYGSEVKDIISEVEYYNTETESVEIISAKDCLFGYRDSIFKNQLRSKIVVISVTFKLNKIFTPNVRYGNIINELDTSKELTAKIIRDTIIKIRSEKLPDPKKICNGGSFFKNPIVTVDKFNDLKSQNDDIPSYSDVKGIKIPAGWLIDRAGWKGYREGDVGVHKNQALVLVNYGGGSGKDVISLADKIIKDVNNKFGIILSPEINIL